MFQMFRDWLEENFEEHEAEQLMGYYRATGEYPEEFLQWTEEQP